MSSSSQHRGHTSFCVYFFSEIKIVPILVLGWCALRIKHRNFVFQKWKCKFKMPWLQYQFELDLKMARHQNKGKEHNTTGQSNNHQSYKSLPINSWARVTQKRQQHHYSSMRMTRQPQQHLFHEMPIQTATKYLHRPLFMWKWVECVWVIWISFLTCCFTTAGVVALRCSFQKRLHSSAKFVLWTWSSFEVCLVCGKKPQRR